jgi:predicted dehydrogenase
MKTICVIGAGRWGKNHIKTLHNLGTLGGIVETHAPRLLELKTEYPNIPLFNNVNDAIEHGFDGFIIATPAETHFKLGKIILENKIPVLIEKPMTLKEETSAKLVEIAKKYSTQLMVGHVLLFHPAIQKIKDLIDNGKIGDLQYIYSNRLNLGTVRKEENVFWSFAPHDLSIFEYLIGAEPIAIESTGGAFLQSHIHDTTMTTLSYPENIKTHIFVSWLHPFKEHRMVIIGSKGMLSFEDSSKEKNILFYEKGVDWINGEPITRNGATEIIKYEKGMPLTNELTYFIENMDKKISIADGTSGLNVVKILEKATKSLID